MSTRIINRIVQVAEGKLEGVPAGNPAYTIFKGVPFAHPPVGEYRWRSAAVPEQWDGIRKCDEFPPISVQRRGDLGFYAKEFFPAAVAEDEDCLYLNIWTPDTQPEEKLPVMMWIHGGGYSGGYSYEMEFDGEAFCRRGVILVTVPYRLGALGFFAHPELSKRCPYGVSGNYGLSDCIRALEWLNENISAFGGDPENITIFGQSAGGGMVQSLVTSPKTTGLFKRAIVQSAGGINTLGGDFTLKDAEELGEKICNAMGKTIDELFELEAGTLTENINSAFTSLGLGGLRIMPNVDGFFLSASPGKMIAEGKHHDIEYMTGSVAGDGGLFGGIPVHSKEEFENQLRAAYGEFADKYIALFDVKSDADVAEACNKRKAAASLNSPRSWAKAELANGRKPLYIYYFNRMMPGDDAGAFHSSELWYVFGTLDRCWRSLTDGFTLGDYALSRAMTDYWTNFAKTGNPNGGSLPEWKAYTSDHPLTMIFNEKKISAEDMSYDKIADGMADLLVEQLVPQK